MKKYENFWNEVSSIEEIDYDDEKVNRLLRWKAIQENLHGVKKILDVGAATGAFSIPLAKMGYEVTHFDFSPEMMSYAKSKVEGVDNIRFMMGDATNLCMFEDCEFDLVLCFDGAISFSGKDADKVIENCCRVGKKVMLTVSSKACMGATWLNYSMNTFHEIHPSVMNMMKNGYFSKNEYTDVDNMTGIMDLKAYDVPELSQVLNANNMKVIECRSIGSLTHLYLLHLYRQHNKIEVHEIINDISMRDEFIELCDYYDKHVMSNGMGSFRRAGIIAIAEHAGQTEFFCQNENAPVHNKPNHLGTSVIIEYEGKILLEHRKDSDMWALIGGDMKTDESLQACAIREVFEETGLQLAENDIQLYNIYDDPSNIASYPDGNIFRIVTAVYKTVLQKMPVLVCDSESKELKFFSKEQLQDIKIAETHKPIIKEYLSK